MIKSRGTGRDQFQARHFLNHRRMDLGFDED
jgi:hypothetical protein